MLIHFWAILLMAALCHKAEPRNQQKRSAANVQQRKFQHAQDFTLGKPLDRKLSRGICSLVKTTCDKLALLDLNSKDHSRE